MLGKVHELIPAIAQNIQALLVNATKPLRVYKALKGEEVIGTIIERG
jgi:isopentenyl phosphate kinase